MREDDGLEAHGRGLPIALVAGTLPLTRIAGTGGNNGGVFHGAVFFEYRVDLSDCRFLLTAGDVNTVDVGIFLGQNRINRASCFADLAVTDDQLALAASHRGHGINGLQTGITRFVHTLSGDNTRRNHFDPAELFGIDGPLAVKGFADGRDNTAQNGFTDRHLGNLAGTLDHVAFFDMDVLTHDRDTHVVFFKVENQPEDIAGKFYQFQGHHLREPA